jgi:hypothetical protein
MNKEPLALRRGKAFHRQVQAEWLAETKDGKPCPERTIKRLNGRRGRVDLLIEELGGFVSVIEIKATDWDRMAERNIKRNVRRQIRQLWGYIDAELEIYGMQVCPGIIFPTLPSESHRLAMIESMFNDEGIQVVWQNETIDEVKQRMLKVTN